MKNNLKSRVDLFASNTQEVKKGFIWQNAPIKRLAALLYATEDKAVDCASIRDCHELIKRETGIFSTFRGNMAICVAALLSLSGDRDRQIGNTLAVYDMMKEYKFRASDYLVLAAYQTAAHSESAGYRQTVGRARAFYDGMKANHWFHTGHDDYIFSAMLGISDVDVNTGLARMEQLYSTLRPEFFSGNSVQALTQVLVLGGESAGAVQRVLTLRKAFRSHDIRLDREYTLPLLGVLALLPDDVDSIVSDVSAAYDLLRVQKGFGIWSVAKQELLLFAASLAASIDVDEAKSGVMSAALSTSLTNIIIAQQTAAIAASSAAAASAASSSS